MNGIYVSFGLYFVFMLPVGVYFYFKTRVNGQNGW